MTSRIKTQRVLIIDRGQVIGNLNCTGFIKESCSYFLSFRIHATTSCWIMPLVSSSSPHELNLPKNTGTWFGCLQLSRRMSNQLSVLHSNDDINSSVIYDEINFRKSLLAFHLKPVFVIANFYQLSLVAQCLCTTGDRILFSPMRIDSFDTVRLLTCRITDLQQEPTGACETRHNSLFTATLNNRNVDQVALRTTSSLT